MHRSRMSVTRQHPRGADPKNVDVVTLAHDQDEWPKRDSGRLWDPFAFISVKFQRGADENIRHHPSGLRLLVGDLALIDELPLGLLLSLRCGLHNNFPPLLRTDVPPICQATEALLAV